MLLSQAQTCAGQVWCYALCTKFVIHSVIILITFTVIKSQKKYFLCIVLDLRIQNQILEDLHFYLLLVMVLSLLIIQLATSFITCEGKSSIFYKDFDK